MGKLTTHILDTTLGSPAQNVKINLYKREGNNSVLINSAQTNSDGRCDEPLLSGTDFCEGCFELEFAVGDYFESKQINCPFLKDVVIRFYISDESENYHVPLLISPYSYSTYRGS
jgi:5-hydroxyisourate hydrolase